MPGAPRDAYDWPPEAQAKLLALWPQSEIPLAIVAAQISPRLTANAVSKKARRLDLTGRQYDGQRYGGGPMPQSQGSMMPANYPASKVRPEGLAATKPPDAAPGPPPSEYIPPVKACAWPMWEHGNRPTHRYCGAAKVQGQSYCPKHLALAFPRAK